MQHSLSLSAISPMCYHFSFYSLCKCASLCVLSIQSNADHWILFFGLTQGMSLIYFIHCKVKESRPKNKITSIIRIENDEQEKERSKKNGVLEEMDVGLK